MQKIGGVEVASDKEAVYSSPREFRSLALSPKIRSFTRTVLPWRAGGLPTVDFTEHIDQADREFAHLGNLSPRLEVVPYRWCLIPVERVPGYEIDTDHFPILPPGYILGARVEKASDARPLRETEIEFANQMLELYQSRNTRDACLGDLAARQLVAQVSPSDIMPVFTYIDVDPILTHQHIPVLTH